MPELGRGGPAGKGVGGGLDINAVHRTDFHDRRQFDFILSGWSHQLGAL